RNALLPSGDLRRIAREHEMPIVIIGSERAGRRIRVVSAGERKLRVPPGKFSVIQFGVKLDVVTRVCRNLNPEMRCISRARWNQMHVDSGARGPSIALVDGIRM